jgi:hypothetical protein
MATVMPAVGLGMSFINMGFVELAKTVVGPRSPMENEGARPPLLPTVYAPGPGEFCESLIS